MSIQLFDKGAVLAIGNVSLAGTIILNALGVRSWTHPSAGVAILELENPMPLAGGFGVVSSASAAARITALTAETVTPEGVTHVRLSMYDDAGAPTDGPMTFIIAAAALTPIAVTP